MIELYRFSELGGAVYTFTSSLFPTTFNLEIYRPISIERGNLTKTDNLQKASLTISIDIRNTFAKAMLSALTEKPIKLELFRNEQIYYLGKVTKIKQSGKKIIFTCESSWVNFAAIGQMEEFVTYCRHKTVYSIGCTLSRTAFEAQYPVIGLSGSTLLIPGISHASGYYTNGIARLNGQERTIIHQEDQTLYLDMAFVDNTTGLLYLYPGCDLQKSTCHSKFNNHKNFGGFRWIPIRDPYNGRGLL